MPKGSAPTFTACISSSELTLESTETDSDVLNLSLKLLKKLTFLG